MTDAKSVPSKLLAALIVCLLIFTATVALALGGTAQHFDEAVLRALRQGGDLSAPVGPDWLLRFMREITALAGTPVLTVATIVLTGWFAVRREWAALAILLAAVLGETLLANGLKALFDRARPHIAPALVHVTGHSFPSGHSTSAAAIYLTMAALIARKVKQRAARLYVFGAAIALALIVGASRVYLGVHYPTDVLAGLSLGAAWAATVGIAARRLRR